MKKLFSIMAIAVLAAVSFTSCSKDDDPVVADTQTVDFEGSYYDALIDHPQYGGKLLSSNDYSWKDATTTLTSSLTKAYGGYSGFSEGGIAIADTIDADIKNHADWNHQLAVPVSNGSKNFAVVYCNSEIGAALNTSMSFADGKAHIIKSMDICPTTYTLGVAKYGNGYGKALTSSTDYLAIVVTGYNGTTKTQEARGYIVENGKLLLDKWITTSLEELGAVTKLEFSMIGSDVNTYGTVSYLNTPAYFAIDNIVIKK